MFRILRTSRGRPSGSMNRRCLRPFKTKPYTPKLWFTMLEIRSDCGPNVLGLVAIFKPCESPEWLFKEGLKAIAQLNDDELQALAEQVQLQEEIEQWLVWLAWIGPDMVPYLTSTWESCR